ncbi:MAG: hypothetical protein WCD45_10800, partial [Gallionella sp.]
GLANQMNTPKFQAPQPTMDMPTSIIPSKDSPDWRDFRTLSAHPNGEEIFFVECQKNLAENCRVLRFNLKTRSLAYYALPKGYAYLEVYLSPSGKKLALLRASQQATTFPENLERREIAIMNTDGTEFEVLPLALGPKTTPTFNASDDRLAFWRAKPRTDSGAKTLASGYDVWEYDLKTGKEYAFGASYRFFQAGEIHYLPGVDELLVKGHVPSGEALLGLNLQNYEERYPNYVFRLRRGQTVWVAPLFANESFKNLMRLALSRDGAMVFDATPSKGATSIYRQEPGGGFRQWSTRNPWDVFDTAALFYSTLIGNQFIGIFNNKDAQREPDLMRFLILNMQTGEWRALSIPPLSAARAIPVTLK